MELRRLLRQLVIADVALAVSVVVIELVAEQFLPQPLRAWADQQAEATRPRDVLVLVIALPLLAALVTSWIGLWRLWRPARWLYVLVLVGGLLAEVLMGTTVVSGVGAAISTLESIVDGMIVALVYLTPLS